MFIFWYAGIFSEYLSQVHIQGHQVKVRVTGAKRHFIIASNVLQKELSYSCRVLGVVEYIKYLLFF